MQNACKTDGDAEHDGIRVPQQIADWVMPLFTQHVDKAWYFCKSECVIIMNTSLNHMITNAFWLFCGILDDLTKNGCQFTKEIVSRMFWFCIAWSLAGMLEKKDRDRFDMYVRPLQPGSPRPALAHVCPALSFARTGDCVPGGPQKPQILCRLAGDSHKPRTGHIFGYMAQNTIPRAPSPPATPHVLWFPPLRIALRIGGVGRLHPHTQAK